MVEMFGTYLAKRDEDDLDDLFNLVVEEARTSTTNKYEKWRNLFQTTTSLNDLLDKLRLTKKQFVDEIIKEFDLDNNFDDVDFIDDYKAYIQNDHVKIYKEDEMEYVAPPVTPRLAPQSTLSNGKRRIQPTLIHK